MFSEVPALVFAEALETVEPDDVDPYDSQGESEDEGSTDLDDENVSWMLLFSIQMPMFWHFYVLTHVVRRRVYVKSGSI